MALNVKLENEFRFGVITFFPHEENSSFFEIEIELSCKGKPVDLHHTHVCCNLRFTIYADSVNDVFSMENYVYDLIFHLFPKNIIDYYEFILIWDVSLDITQIDQKIMAYFSKNPLFDVIEIHNLGVRPRFITTTLERHPLLKWTMKMSNKYPVFTLEEIACEFLAKECMNKMIEEHRMIEDSELFVHMEFHDDGISEYLFKKMSFVNKIFLMDPEQVPEIKKIFLKRMQSLELNHNIIKKLRSYFPCPEDYETRNRQP